MPSSVTRLNGLMTTDPPPEPGGDASNVAAWWWTRFSAGSIPASTSLILDETGVGTGDPTLPYTFNLGGLCGLEGIASVVPYLIAMALWLALFWRVTKRHGHA